MAESKKKAQGRPGGPGGRMMPGEKAKDFGKTMKTLIGYLKPYKFRLAIVFIFAIASTVFTIISPTILGDATDKVVEGLMSGMGIDFSGLASILFLLLATLRTAACCSESYRDWMMADVSQKVIYIPQRQDVDESSTDCRSDILTAGTHGEIQSRMINDIETVNQTLSVSLTQMITSFTTIVGILIMMLRISVVMTLMALVVLPLSMGVITPCGLQIAGPLQEPAEVSRFCKRARRGNVCRSRHRQGFQQRGRVRSRLFERVQRQAL